MLHRLTISKRITLLALITILLFASQMVIEAQHKRDDLLAAKKDRLMQLVEVAHNTLAGFHTRQKQGELSQENAQQLAKEVVRGMRYDQDNYFWINDLNAVSIMHPVKSELEGKSVYDVADQKGTYLFRDFVAIVKEQGAGFANYYWTRPNAALTNDHRELPKLSYVKGFEPWGWIIGTGVFVDDIEEQFVSELRKRLLITTVLLLVLVALSIYIGFSIIKPLRRTTGAMNRIASFKNDLSVRMPVEGENELSELASGFNHFADRVCTVTEALERKEGRLKEAQTLAHLGDWEWNLTKGGMHWSDQTFALLGYRRKDTKPDIKLFRRAIPSANRQDFDDLIKRIKQGQEAESVYQLPKKTLSPIYIRVRGRLRVESEQHSAVIIGTIQDVTMELELRKLIEEKQELYQQMFENNSAIKLLVDPQLGSVVDANGAALDYYGYSLDQLKKLRITDINTASETEIKRLMELAKANKQRFFPFQHRLASGEIRDVEVYSGPVNIKDKVYLHSIVFDVTERNQLQRQLQDAAMRDSLTDLYNRRAIDIEGERAFLFSKRNNTELAVMMIDIDHFKRINDNYGHPVGDIVLKAVSDEIATLARGSDILGRYGGEEFVLLAPGSDLEGAMILAERIRAAIDNKVIEVQGQGIKVTVSAGVAVMSAAERTVYDIIARADRALYEAKQGGRNQISG